MESIDSSNFATQLPGAIAALRRFARPRAPQERCDLCATPLADPHEHLFEPATRALHCACDACAVLFSSAAAARFKRVPRRIVQLARFRLSDEQWAGLGIPIGLAFIFRSGATDQVLAVYPSPGGPIETPLPAEAWQALTDGQPCLAEWEPDVEALLIHRINGARDYYRAPIDECYKLVGLIRLHWRGLSGGSEAWKQVRGFFEGLASRAWKARDHA